MKIPKKIHFYWGNDKMSFLRYMTIYSFRKYNHDWDIYLYIPKKRYDVITWKNKVQKYNYRGEDYFNKLYDLENIKILEFDMEDIGFTNDISEVIKSDILRLYFLYKYGGVWSDMDFIYFKNFDCSQLTLDYDGMLCFNNKYHSVDFLASCKDSLLFKNLFDNTKIFLNVKEYQSVGSRMYNKVLGTNLKIIRNNFGDILNMPIEVVHPFSCNEVDLLISDKELMERITNKTIGFHWFAGHPYWEKFQNEITIDNFSNFNNIFLGKIINKTINGDF